MKYLLLIYNTATGPDLDADARLQGHMTLFKELDATKNLLTRGLIEEELFSSHCD